MEHIASRENEKIKYAKRLATSAAFRAEEGLFFAEGRRLCFDLAETCAPTVAFVTAAFLKGCPQAASLAPQVFIISQPVDDKLSETKTPQGVYCLFKTPATSIEDLNPEAGILLCEDLQNPANVGAVLRSAAAFGFGGVVLAGSSADAYSPKALRASMGGVGRIPVLTSAALAPVAQALHKKGVTIYAAALEGGTPLPAEPLQKPFALLIGNEGAGLSPVALSLADKRVYIPMQNGMESLNAAVAASVLMFHFAEK
ncbi:RNA methyltransferase [Ruminococcaceae bacterium OttesenSCG-928-A16]|nr:RNA methyltransferase [Ruminococcaceae bacterium OttesenSCG-928-A16]